MQSVHKCNAMRVYAFAKGEGKTTVGGDWQKEVRGNDSWKGALLFLHHLLDQHSNPRGVRAYLMLKLHTKMKSLGIKQGWHAIAN